jgi:hypothetical protein
MLIFPAVLNLIPTTMKSTLITAITAVLLFSCEHKETTVVPADKGDTTVVNPPDKHETTIVNPPANEKTTEKKTETTIMPGGSTTEKKETTTEQK